jgi:chromosome segregation ATPase
MDSMRNSTSAANKVFIDFTNNQKSFLQDATKISNDSTTFITSINQNLEKVNTVNTTPTSLIKYIEATSKSATSASKHTLSAINENLNNITKITENLVDLSTTSATLSSSLQKLEPSFNLLQESISSNNLAQLNDDLKSQLKDAQRYRTKIESEHNHATKLVSDLYTKLTLLANAMIKSVR